jgi:asparagine synthase (glutamine-hydrolysing)
MSGVLGVFASAPGRGSHEDGVVQRMLQRMRGRGSDCAAVWQRHGAALAVARNAWELAPEFSGDALVMWEGDLVLAADASLYYRADLLRKLEPTGARLAGMTSSHLLLAAYRAWGEQCVRYLEGDYAFIVWDRVARRLFCARDFAGSRPLFYAEVGRTLLVASTLTALRAHPECPSDLNRAFLAETAANLWLPPEETAYARVTAIPAGFSLSWTTDGPVALSRHWQPPAIESRQAPPLADAAVELQGRLSRAVEERLASRDVTTVWMSGGRDSTAVFGSGQHVLRRGPGARELRPVSVSYPPGHAGREDEFISSVAQFWKVTPQWLDIGQIPFFEHPAQRAAGRDEPYEPLYEMFSRALARGTRAVGARVALDGWGGDQLFEMSPVYLADLFRTGRWVSLAREWRALQVRDFRYFFQMAIAPTLPPFLRAAAAALRGGRRLPGQNERWMPPWMSARWMKTLTERQRLHLPARDSNSFSSHELLVSLAAATAARVRGWLTAVAFEQGVEVRSPLYDGRIIELAVRRPACERRSGRETKTLLRAAMRGLLPEDVLAPRRIRTGVIGDVFRSAMQTMYPRLVNKVLDSPVLAELGIIDPRALRRVADISLSRTWNDEVAAALFFTLQTELWLQARTRPDSNDNTNGSHADGHSVAVLPPGKRPGHTQTMEVNGVQYTEA